MSLPLRIQWSLPVLMLLALPFTDKMALSPARYSVVQLFAYPLAHANLLHLILNAVAWLPMWRAVTWRRLLCAYMSSVGIGYIYMLIPSAHPLCGFSVIIFWFIGLMLPLVPRTTRLLTLALVAVSFLMPHLAASVHLMALLSGYIYYTLRRLRPKY